MVTPDTSILQAILELLPEEPEEELDRLSDSEDGERQAEHADHFPMELDTNGNEAVLAADRMSSERGNEGKNAEEIFEDEGAGCKPVLLPIDSDEPKVVSTASARLASKRKREKRRRQKHSAENSKFVRDTCRRLQEPKVNLVGNAVKKLGADVVQELVLEVEAIERCGGQTTADGKRKRTPGGVLWNILRARLPPPVYREIIADEKEIQRRKQKGRAAGQQKAKPKCRSKEVDSGCPVSSDRLGGATAGRESTSASVPTETTQMERARPHRGPMLALPLAKSASGPLAAVGSELDKPPGTGQIAHMQRMWAQAVGSKMGIESDQEDWEEGELREEATAQDAGDNAREAVSQSQAQAAVTATRSQVELEQSRMTGQGRIQKDPAEKNGKQEAERIPVKLRLREPVHYDNLEYRDVS